MPCNLSRADWLTECCLCNGNVQRNEWMHFWVTISIKSILFFRCRFVSITPKLSTETKRKERKKWTHKTSSSPRLPNRRCRLYFGLAISTSWCHVIHEDITHRVYLHTPGNGFPLNLFAVVIEFILSSHNTTVLIIVGICCVKDANDCSHFLRRVKECAAFWLKYLSVDWSFSTIVHCAHKLIDMPHTHRHAVACAHRHTLTMPKWPSGLIERNERRELWR